MGIDQKFLGFALPTFTVVIDPERLTRFAKAIGHSNYVVSRDAPPITFLKVIEGEGGSSRRILQELGVDLRRILHAEQHFDYFAPLRVGDVVTVERKVVDIYEKKTGEMEFIVIESTFVDSLGILVGKSRQIVLVRNPKKQLQ